jgi:hypothetical protein
MRLATITLLTALSLGATDAAPALAFDLTGSWQGSWSCVGTLGGLKDKDFNKESTLVVTSLGNNTFASRLDGNLGYRGIEIPDAKNAAKGEIGIVHCGSTDDLTQAEFFESGRFKVSTKGDKGTISGITIYSFEPNHIATCKYKYKRVDTTNPNLTYGGCTP